jgi:hypothetical protein
MEDAHDEADGAHSEPCARRPDLSDYRRISTYRITLESVGRRDPERHDGIAAVDAMIGSIVDELASLVARSSIAHEAAAQLLPAVGRTRNAGKGGRRRSEAGRRGAPARVRPGANREGWGKGRNGRPLPAQLPELASGERVP